MTPARRRTDLSRAECLRMVSSVPFGRVVFTVRALPAIQPVSHLVAGTQIIIRASLGAAFSSAAHGSAAVVAYQADLIDSGRRAGWSVVVIGRARRVTSEAHAARYREALPSWIDGEMDEVIAIDADLVTGFRIVPVAALAGLG
jgi:Pyridoxamine 5'-phosphate oxidase